MSKAPDTEPGDGLNLHGHSRYTREIATTICRRLAEGETLRAICRDEGMPPESTVRGWAVDDVDGFAAQYAKAREIGYFSMADDLLEISDDGRNDWMERNAADDAGWALNGEHINRSRLRVDTRKWLLSKALPKIYGDKLALGGADDLPPIQTEDTGARDKLAALIARQSAAGSSGSDTGGTD